MQLLFHSKWKRVIFNASSSVAKQYRWDFDNDGIYDTSWLYSPVIKHVYSKPYNGFAKLLVRNEYGMDEKLVRVIACDDEDQKQEEAEDFVKIYRGKKYAQTFKPTMLNLTSIKIYVARKGLSLKIFDRISFLKKYLKNFLLGDLLVYIYRYKNGNPEGELLTYVKLSPDEISKEGSWVSIDLKGIILAKDLEEWGIYSIVLYHSGGNPRNYYKWYYAYNDPYPNGTFYYYEGGRWKEDVTRDFTFVTYGKPTGDEPDGVEERWAVLLAGPNLLYTDNDITDTKNVLINHGWDVSHIWTIYSDESKSKFEEAIMQMKENEDMDDICIVGWSSHGNYINYQQVDKWLDDYACKGLLIVVDSCDLV